MGHPGLEIKPIDGSPPRVCKILSVQRCICYKILGVILGYSLNLLKFSLSCTCLKLLLLVFRGKTYSSPKAKGQREGTQWAVEQHKEKTGDCLSGVFRVAVLSWKASCPRPAVLWPTASGKARSDRRMSLATCEQSKCRLNPTTAPFFCVLFF